MSGSRDCLCGHSAQMHLARDSDGDAALEHCMVAECDCGEFEADDDGEQVCTHGRGIEEPCEDCEEEDSEELML